MDQDIVAKIKATLAEVCAANCQCCQGERSHWLSDLGWEWIEVAGPNAIARFGFKIADTRLEVFSRPGVLSNCLSSSKELEAPAK